MCIGEIAMAKAEDIAGDEEQRQRYNLDGRGWASLARYACRLPSI